MLKAFEDWLHQQELRTDEIGRFARMFFNCYECRTCRTISSLDRHLQARQPDLLPIRDLAWREFAHHDLNSISTGFKWVDDINQKRRERIIKGFTDFVADLESGAILWEDIDPTIRQRLKEAINGIEATAVRVEPQGQVQDR